MATPRALLRWTGRKQWLRYALVNVAAGLLALGFLEVIGHPSWGWWFFLAVITLAGLFVEPDVLRSRNNTHAAKGNDVGYVEDGPPPRSQCRAPASGHARKSDGGRSRRCGR